MPEKVPPGKPLTGVLSAVLKLIPEGNVPLGLVQVVGAGLNPWVPKVTLGPFTPTVNVTAVVVIIGVATAPSAHCAGLATLPLAA